MSRPAREKFYIAGALNYRCNLCKVVKPDSAFYRAYSYPGSPPQSFCKPCHIIKAQKYRVNGKWKYDIKKPRKIRLASPTKEAFYEGFVKDFGL